MSTIRSCAECGAPLIDEAGRAYCPACALWGALALSDGRPDTVVTEKTGDLIGRYRLVEKIGEGGCGVVYLAEQSVPIRRRVALKIVKLGMDTRQVIARFEAERQALALMDHPNIARVFDAGATDTGRPYFVMELVAGVRITDFCDQHNLSTRERLDLFMQVCHAVQHAHQKGIIHRDIKPSNILVASPDGTPVPKVIDFGIAKATQQPLSDKTVYTALQQFVGTPAYMSPEQAELDSHDIDTRSDVYTLGVLLYELLTGRMPFESEALLQAGFDEMRRLIREQEPPRPSTRLKALPPDAQSAVAKRQQTDPPKLLDAVRGDLDWIVMRCLEKDRARRYDTASDLARDVERHLKNEPVAAAAPGTLYRAGKFVRRHRVGLSMAAGLILLLAAGVVVSVWQGVRATRAEHEQSRLREEAEKARQEAETRKHQAEAALTEAEAQRNQAQVSLAEAERQKTEKEAALRDSQAAQTNALNALEVAQLEKARAEEAVLIASDAKARAEAARSEALRQQAEVESMLDLMLTNLSDKLRSIGRIELLGDVTERVLDHYQSLPGDDQSANTLARRAMVFRNLSHVLAVQGDSTNALDARLTSLSLTEKLAAGDASNLRWQEDLSLDHRKIGEIREALGDSDLALDEFDKSLALSRALTSRFPRNARWQADSLASLVKIGDVRWVQADQSGALAAYREAFQVATLLGQLDPADATWQRDLSASYGRLGPLWLQEWGADTAYRNCTNGLELARIQAARDPANTRWQANLAIAHDNLADVLLARKELKPALAHYQEALRIRQLLVATDPANTQWQRDLVRSFFKVGHALPRASRPSKALETFVESQKALLDFPLKNMELVELLFAFRNKNSKPLETYQECLKVAQQLADKDPGNVQWQEDLAQSHTLFGDLLLESGQNERALEAYQAALRIRRQLADRDTNAITFQYWKASAHASVAAGLWRLSRKDEALQEVRSAFHILQARISTWPRNFVLLEGPRAGEKNISAKVMLNPALRGDVQAAFRRGFDAARKQVGLDSANPRRQEEWAGFCSDMAVFQLLFGDIDDAVQHARNAVEVWKKLSHAAPDNSTYRTNLSRACIALAAYQLGHGQPQAAIQSARWGLETHIAETACEGVLALAYWCDNQPENARRLLQACQGLKVSRDQTFPDAVADDLRRLCENGLANPYPEPSPQPPAPHPPVFRD